MATVASSSDQVAGSLEKLTLHSQTKSSKVPEPAKKGGYGDNSTLMYQQSYGFMPYGTYTMSSSPLAMGYDAQMLQEYHYPSHYQVSSQTGRPSVTGQGSATQVEVSTSDANDLASLSVETNKANSSIVGSGGAVSGNKLPKSLKPMSQKSAANSNGYHGRRGLPTGNILPGYQDPTFNYDVIQSAPWLDASMSSAGQSKYGASGGFSTHTSNTSSSGNQNLYTFPHLLNTSLTSGMGQGLGFMNNIYANMTYGHYGSTMRGGSGWPSFGYDSWKRGHWHNGGNYSKSRGYGFGKENSDGLSELNRGPRGGKGPKNQDELGGRNLPLSESNKDNELPLIPNMEHYNNEDFPESYSDAKIFVIKSYSEDDVHKSIKYGVWSSTSNGNKKLDAAYHEAKAKPHECPVFLLFSVNTSGQFVGLAEMVGPVDFNKIVGYWQQDKWIGCFPVKWHIIKDVPNSLLRHITLENNENKPVTNSRDTQEVNLEQGIQILKIFKGHSSKTCILDDFEFYEDRQKIMQEKKARHQQLQKQVSDVRPRDGVITDGKDKVAMGNETVEKSLKAAVIEEPAVAVAALVANGEVKSFEENGSVAEATANSVAVASAC